MTCFRCGTSNPSSRLFCTSCGYDLSDKPPNPDLYLGPNGRPILARLTFQNGQNAGRSYLFHQVMTTIGRTNGNNLVISGRTVSRRHARLWFDNGQWFLEDLQSANGTSVNNMRISYQPIVLKDGDIINFGDEVVLFNEVFNEYASLPGSTTGAISSPEETKSVVRTQEIHLSLFAIAHAELGGRDIAFVRKIYSVQAGISQSKPEKFEGEPFDLSVSDIREPLPFDILLHASENIELLTAWHKHLRYNPHDPEPQLVEFTFWVVAPGLSSLDINFYHERRWLRTIHFELDAVEQSQPASVSAEE